VIQTTTGTSSRHTIALRAVLDSQSLILPFFKFVYTAAQARTQEGAEEKAQEHEQEEVLQGQCSRRKEEEKGQDWQVIGSQCQEALNTKHKTQKPRPKSLTRI
jgi:hypothetical protein